jgi:hypothetical protein
MVEVDCGVERDVIISRMVYSLVISEFHPLVDKTHLPHRYRRHSAEDPMVPGGPTNCHSVGLGITSYDTCSLFCPWLLDWCKVSKPVTPFGGHSFLL